MSSYGFAAKTFLFLLKSVTSGGGVGGQFIFRFSLRTYIAPGLDIGDIWVNGLRRVPLFKNCRDLS